MTEAVREIVGESLVRSTCTRPKVFCHYAIGDRVLLLLGGHGPPHGWSISCLANRSRSLGIINLLYLTVWEILSGVRGLQLVFSSYVPWHLNSTLNSRPQLRCDYPLNLSISVSGGKETNEDSLSNGEWTGISSSLKSGAFSVCICLLKDKCVQEIKLASEL